MYQSTHLTVCSTIIRSGTNHYLHVCFHDACQVHAAVHEQEHVYIHNHNLLILFDDPLVFQRLSNTYKFKNKNKVD